MEMTVYVWAKGGAPGQVIMSQQGGANWVQTDANGALMSELTSSDSRISGTPLYSEVVITDGHWHRLGFVWDGSQRNLYVDGVHVATDSQSGLSGSTGGLVIGGSQAGSFFSGLIDEVRIYNRAVRP